MKQRNNGRQSGSATIVIIVAVIVCGGLSSAVLLTNAGRSRLAKTESDSERALQLAEAGADWATTRVRILGGVVPNVNETRTIAGIGSVLIRYAQGNVNGLDDNGNGTVDDAAESSYATVLATGSAGGVQRTVRIVLRRAQLRPGQVSRRAFGPIEQFGQRQRAA